MAGQRWRVAGWWRRRSLRARLTLATSAGLALALALAAVLLVSALHASLVRDLDVSARQGAVEVAALLDEGRLPSPVPVAPGTLTIQVLDATGRITNISPGADRLVPVPDEVGLADAVAVLHDGATALGLMAGTGVRSTEWVLILGATGAMGLLLTQLARAAGGRVLAGLRVAGAPRGEAKAGQARAAGAEAVIDYSGPDWAAEVTAMTGGGPAVVFDGVGGSLGVAAFGTLADGGRFSGHGAAAGGFAPVDRAAAGRRGITVQGIEQAHFPPGGHEKLAAQALADVAAGRMRPVIGQSYPLDRAAEAQAGLEKRSAIGKTVLIVDEGAA